MLKNIRLKDLFVGATWVPILALARKWAIRAAIILTVLAIVWVGLKYVPIDILRGDAGFFLTTDSVVPDESYRLRVQQNDLRIYEKRSMIDPRVLCIGWYGDIGAWGDCVFIPDYVAPVDPEDVPEIPDPTLNPQ